MKTNIALLTLVIISLLLCLVVRRNFIFGRLQMIPEVPREYEVWTEPTTTIEGTDMPDTRLPAPSNIVPTPFIQKTCYKFLNQITCQ